MRVGFSERKEETQSKKKDTNCYTKWPGEVTWGLLGKLVGEFLNSKGAPERRPEAKEGS